MKIEATELVSRSTQVSGRTLVILSATVLLILGYDLNSTAWPIIADRQISPQQFVEISLTIIIFASVAHLINWWADWVSYTKWFQTSSTAINTMDELGTFGSEEPILGAIIRRINQLKESNYDKDDGPSLSTSDRLDVLERSITEIRLMLSEIKPGFRWLSLTSWVIVYVWFLALPLGLSFTAICRLMAI